jgi:flagellar basal-body rod modification protein FlgD
MEIGAATTQTISATDSSGKKLAKEFDNFLILLTTQLQNQDPLEPLDSNEFTAQLVRFTNVEQAISQNKKLDQLVELFQATGGAFAVNYLGKDIEAIGSEADLKNGQAQWAYQLSTPSEATTVLVKNSAGDVVFSTKGDTSALKQGFVWDGKTTGGFDAPEGVYDIEVVATKITGKQIPVETTIGGVVTGVEILDGQQMLAIGGAKVSINNVLAVTQG